jgi:hypothetical protein
MELGTFALDIDDQEIAARAFRSVTLMKAPTAEAPDAGASPAQRAVAYHHLAVIARAQGDRRKARLLAEKAVAEDGSLEVARALLDELKG